MSNEQQGLNQRLKNMLALANKDIDFNQYTETE